MSIIFILLRQKQIKKSHILEKNCLTLLKNIDFYRKKYKFKLYGYVIMPDHIHLMIEPALIADGVKPSAEQSDVNYDIRLGDGFTPSQSSSGSIAENFIPSLIQNIIHDIKGKTAFDIRKNNKINDKIWQKSFHQIQIYSAKFFDQKLTYIHENPLKADLVKDTADYKWSSYRNIYLNDNSLIEIDRPIL